jgi:hypothetical protein
MNFARLQKSKGIWSRRHSVSFVADSSSSHSINLKRRNSVDGHVPCETMNSETRIDNPFDFMFSAQDTSTSIADSGAQLCMDQLFVLDHDWAQAQSGKESTIISDPIRVVHCELPVPPPSVFQRKCRRSTSAAKD